LLPQALLGLRDASAFLLGDLDRTALDPNCLSASEWSCTGRSMMATKSSNTPSWERPDNRWLREAMEQQTPIIYFLGTSPGRYQPIIPTFIVGWHPDRLRVQLAFGAIVGASADTTPPLAPERRYALREVKARLHQASFRDAVLAAYDGRCAISKLPEPRLLDAAHIMVDQHEQLGQPVVSNGLPLTKLPCCL
jgi:hypothetical protein